ncbi:class I SAM-dependent methyltransferase [Microbacterium sp. SORGH_AS_0888]|uniref:class I SAM-dependent methyltransferase n=1 Tax=Microbacterium sp. SORGH_AS_0888 TaxID=3041791 RepID=UPI00277EF5AF|nr:class I SAM-dependent methyltransferase [Microbacterium sp. SORGH_AS_0888]MDQ1128136.1 SAM-dependent methyltransferase [Microbacterium sp. SORGH_AS_0888]
MADKETMARSFGAVAGQYESGRPDYPVEAVAWLLEPLGDDPRVVDLGAGTGKLTRAIRAAGAAVTAVDPDAEMLAELRRQAPGVDTVVGTGESLPLADGSVDAVLSGQAWHWVDPVAGSAEVGRVLRAGGVFGPIWNVRDDRDPLVRRLTAIMRGSAAEELVAAGGPAPHPPFAAFERRTWEWGRGLDRQQLQDMVASRSYIITSEPAERERILGEVGALFDAESAEGVLTLPYRTEAFRARRP